MAVSYLDIYNVFSQFRVNQLAEDVSFDVVSAGYLMVGKRYKILDASGGADFTTVGSADNVVGTVFIASTCSVLPTWGTGSLQKGYSEQENIETQIDEARNVLASYANINSNTVDETVEFQAQFLIHYTMYLLYHVNNMDVEGEQERKEALMLLQRYWGASIYDGENMESQDTKPLYQATASICNTWTATSLDDYL